ncbi:hypothetical protein V497_09241 [Pseudogymnoascus sp. VKM F-4516 (FW-969)]|nr:hypothetical protein V497_09241 [Pseudogymnoascus sp. VKM F-4516 (FW-969)]
MASNNVSPLFRLLTPLLQTVRRTATPTTTTALPVRSLSSTPANLASGGSMNPKNRGKVVKADPRVQLIRYHLQNSRTPRPLRLSRMRSLRHWTIHRAWMLFRRQKMSEEELELQRMYKSMHNACEELRALQGPGDKNAGRLYRIALEKKGIYGPNGVPIEYARAQTDTPAKEPWDHSWTR